MLISFSNELAKEINPSFWALPKTGNSFLFFGCKPKKKKHSFIRFFRVNPCLILLF